jgi:hypothetical protein
MSHVCISHVLGWTVPFVVSHSHVPNDMHVSIASRFRATELHVAREAAT